MTGGEHARLRDPSEPSARYRPPSASALLANPGFGRVFTDHMVTIRYAEGKGWYDARVEARAPIPMDPATRGAALRPGDLRGAQGLPHGRRRRRRCSGPTPTPAGSATRPPGWRWPSCPRSCSSARCGELISIDREWVPDRPGGQPLPAAVHVRQRGRSSACSRRPEYLYVLIASPVGSYFAGGVKPVTVWVSTDYTRAAPGGTGAAKCGGNYAASLVAQAEAIEHGCDQVVFLDAVERRYVDELGGMNIFFVLRRRQPGHPAADRHDPARHHPRRDHHAGQRGRPRGRGAPGQLRRVARRRRSAAGSARSFACGTAAVITPIGTVRSVDGEFTIGDGGTGAGHGRAAAGAGGHPARPRRGPVTAGSTASSSPKVSAPIMTSRS